MNQKLKENMKKDGKTYETVLSKLLERYVERQMVIIGQKERHGGGMKKYKLYLLSNGI